MNEHYDIAVVGGGPAGAACMLALQSSGRKVLWIERSEFPRDKVCGDAIGGRVKKVLREMEPELLASLEAYDQKSPASGWRLYAPDGNEVEVNFTNPGYVSRRMDFDAWLNAGVRLKNGSTRLHAEVRDVRAGYECIEMQLDGGRRLTTSLVIGCDGAHSIVAKQLAGFKVDHRHYSGAVRAYYRNVAGTASSQLLEIHLVS